MRHKPKPADAPGLTLIQRLMRHYRVTVRDLAAICGTSRSTISRVVHGEMPRLDVAMRMAKVFRVSVEEIWTLPEQEKK